MPNSQVSTVRALAAVAPKLQAPSNIPHHASPNSPESIDILLLGREPAHNSAAVVERRRRLIRHRPAAILDVPRALAPRPAPILADLAPHCSPAASRARSPMPNSYWARDCHSR